jgi:hypothetical protein
MERALIFGGRHPTYQDLTSSGSGTVSLTISHRSWRHTLLNALASACRKTINLSGWYATTKTSPSRLIDTCLRKRALFRNASTVSSTDITPPHILTKPHQSYCTSGEGHWPVPTTDRCGGTRRLLTYSHRASACCKTGEGRPMPRL